MTSNSLLAILSRNALILRYSTFLVTALIISPLGHSLEWLEGNVRPISKETITSKTLFEVHGSNTLGEALLPALIIEYLKAKGVENVRSKTLAENEKLIYGSAAGKEVQVKVESHGSSTGFVGLQSGSAQIAASSRRIKSSEASLLKPIGDMMSKDSEHVVAIDGIAIIVNRSNSVKELSISQVSDLFSGKTSSWSAVGSRSGRVVVYARDSASGTWDTFNTMVLRKQAELTPVAQRYESNTQLAQLVSQSNNAIGFVGAASIQDAKAVPLNIAGHHSMEPNELHLATEDYPLARRLYLYTATVKPTIIAEFIDFVLSNPGQAVVDKMGFVSQLVKPVEVKIEDLPADYQGMVKGFTRLNVNFRFNPGSADMDGKAELDIERLAQYMHSEGKGKRLLLVGFANRQSNAGRSKVISKLRALNVKRRLKNFDVKADVKSFDGEWLIADPDTSLGRAKNQRVEVWVK